MSCEYCSDKYDKHRANKFGYERGDEFITDRKAYDVHIENNGSEYYIYICGHGDWRIDSVDINYCPMCGEKLIIK
jgi:hypothetical protein